MLPAHGIWRETASSCDHEVANEWACCSGQNASYITMHFVSLESQCFPRLRPGRHLDSRERKFTLTLGTNH